MKKSKKITLTAAAMVLSAGLAAGGTLAYLNSGTETKTNTFTSGKNITRTLTETDWTEDSGKNYIPGDVIRKNPVMTNESDQPVYMAIKVDYSDEQGNLMSAEEFAKYAEVLFCRHGRQKQKVPLAGTAGKAKKEPGSSHCPAYAN